MVGSLLCLCQRNARRLDFIGENDRIQRLQLAKPDGSEPEELDVDATLEDVIICMGNKHLVAIVIPTKSSAPCNRVPDAEKLGPCSPMALRSHQEPKFKNDSPYSYGLVPPTPVPTVEETESSTIGLKTVPVLLKRRATRCEPPVRGLKITIPSSDGTPSAAFYDEGGMLANDLHGEHRVFRPQTLGPNPNTCDGVAACKSGGQLGLMNSVPTPSPAELAQFLVKGSSLPSDRRARGVAKTNYCVAQCLGNGIPISGFQSFASALLSRLPIMPASSMVSGGPPLPPTDDIAMLAQFLASQLRAFVPAADIPAADIAHSPPASGPYSSYNDVEDSTIQEEVPSPVKPTETYNNCRTGYRETYGDGFTKLECRNVTASVTACQDKEDTSSSANINMTAAPSNNAMKNEDMHGRSELIFLVNRRSKTGLGAHHLKLSDLSVFFHLSVVDAAKKLGVSQTTLKKACRKFGLKRWPGRKVRSLENTIHGLEHTIAVGQGAGMEQLTEAYMRSEVSKLQQEMDQLVHGTHRQHSFLAKTTDLYKRVHSRGWRSKYHSQCVEVDLDLNVDNRDHCDSATPILKKQVCQAVERVTIVRPRVDSGVESPLTNTCILKQKDSDCNFDIKYSNSISQTQIGKYRDDMVDCNDSKATNFLFVEASNKVDHQLVGQIQNGDVHEDLICEDKTNLQLVEDEDLVCGRSPKRPKVEVT